MYKIYLPSNKQMPSNTSNFHVLMKLGNMMRVPILNPNFSIKYDLKLVSRTKRKNVWSKVDQGLHFA